MLLNLFNKCVLRPNQKQKSSWKTGRAFKTNGYQSTKRTGKKKQLKLRSRIMVRIPKSSGQDFQPFFTTKTNGRRNGPGLACLHFSLLKALLVGEIKVESSELKAITLSLNCPGTGSYSPGRRTGIML